MKLIKIVMMGLLLVTTNTLFPKKFDPEALHTIVKQSIELPEAERMGYIVQTLHKQYDTPLTPTIHLFNGGYAQGLVALLYASVTEYLIIYGTPLSNYGHSGRYLMNIYDFVYRGKVTIASPTEIEGREVPQGHATFLPWGQAHHYSLDKNTWMLEYGYGLTASALPFMLVGIVATADVVGSGYLMYDYGKQVIKNLPGQLAKCLC